MKFNRKRAIKKVVNLAGGEAYKQSDKLYAVSIMLTSFLKNQFYRLASNVTDDLDELLKKNNPLFMAKASIYARTKFGMRSVSHFVAAKLAPYISRKEWGKKYYSKIIHRPDDMLEIMAAYMHDNGTKIPNSIKKGFSEALGRFDEYSLAKYRGEAHDVKLIDLVNLIHPIPTVRNGEALTKLVNGELRSADTWEVRLAGAGQNNASETEKIENKKEVWKDLIGNKKIKYFALLRNLRNIAEQCPEILDEALELLVDENAIKSSLVLPFRFTTASNVIEESDIPSRMQRKINGYIDRAIEISLNNVPSFDGKTLVAIDDSGSMRGKCSQIATLFGAVLAKKSNADIMIFDDEASYINYLTNDTISAIINKIPFNGGATDFDCAFEKANQAYDRIIILSDMQGWIGRHTPNKTSLKAYKHKYNCDPIIYSFDLAGYGSMQFPENNVYCLAGFNDKIFDIMKFCESDKNALINEIEKIQL